MADTATLDAEIPVATTKRGDGATTVTATLGGWRIRWHISPGPVHPRGRKTVRHCERVANAQCFARLFIAEVEQHLQCLPNPDYRTTCAGLLRRWASHGHPSSGRRYEQPMKEAMRAAAGGRATKRQRDRLADHIGRARCWPDTLLAEAIIICCDTPTK